jgi:hypothetical protein
VLDDPSKHEVIRREFQQPSSESLASGSRSVLDRVLRWSPAFVVAAVAVISLLRSGVTTTEILAYAVYWIVTLLLPGTVIVRTIFQSERNLVQDLALGAVTGLALEIASLLALRALGLEGLVRFWWLVPLGLFVAVPRLRRIGFRRYEVWVSRGWAWSMAAMTTLLVMGLDIGWFQRNPLPPHGGSVQRDMWWHLSIIHELMRPGPTQVPQVVGELLNYHTNVHHHLAAASQTTGIDPDVILFRLFLPPLILVAAGLIAFLAGEVSRRSWAGPIAVWLSLIALGGGYLWTGLGKIGTTPLSIGSPTQLLAVPFVLAAGWALVVLIRGSLDLWGWTWLGVVVFIGAGSKPTVVYTLLGGTLVALVAVAFVTRRFPRSIAIAAGGLILVQFWMLADRPRNVTGITVLGSLKVMDVFREISGDFTMRGVNEGLVLDSLSDTTGLTAAAVAVVWLLGFQAILLVGLVALAFPSTRRDPVAWWLAGALSAGWFMFLTLDLMSGNQLYFLRLALPFGAILTSWMVVVAVDKFSLGRRLAYMGAGLGIGAAAAMAAVSATTTAGRSDSFGMIDEVLLPLVVVLIVGGIAFLGWRSLTRHLKIPAAWLALALAFVIGISLPTSINLVASRVTRWTQPVTYSLDPKSGEFLSPLEQQAAVWLHENSSPLDVVATNSHCHPVRESPPCNAIGFWVSGIAGRRVVLEGWSYTPETTAMHGVDGKTRSHQPPPWPDRYALSHAAVEDPTPEVLEELRQRFGTVWLVAVRRAGPVSDRLGDLAELAYENDDVTIYRIK